MKQQFVVTKRYTILEEKERETEKLDRFLIDQHLIQTRYIFEKT